MSLTNAQLWKRLRPLVRTFRGVYSKDQLPNPRRVGFYILNLEDADAGQGTHWVLLQVKAHSNVYFDSYGAPPPVAVRKYTSGTLWYNDGIVQGLNSDNCGRFCAYAMVRLNKGESLDSIIRGFTASYKTNDAMVVRQYKRL